MKGKIICFALILSALGLHAQKYTTAIGGRIGSGLGLTVQQKLWNKTTFEGILNQKFKQDEIIFTALLERHQKLIGKRFNVYMGAGPHFGWNADLETGKTKLAGITAVAGLEFTIARLNLSWDFKPAMNLSGGDKFIDTQTAISLRYVFIKAKKKKINWQFWKKKDGKKKRKR